LSFETKKLQSRSTSLEGTFLPSFIIDKKLYTSLFGIPLTSTISPGEEEIISILFSGSSYGTGFFGATGVLEIERRSLSG